MITNKISARTRVLGAVSYYAAEWQQHDNGDVTVVFLEEKYKGQNFLGKSCVIAKDERWKLKDFNPEEIL